MESVGALVWAKRTQDKNPRKNATTREEVVFTPSFYQEENIVSIDFIYTYFVLFLNLFCSQINAHYLIRHSIVTNTIVD